MGFDRNIHCLTTREQADLRIELKFRDGTMITWTYHYFVVDGPQNKYTLHIGEAEGPDNYQERMAYQCRVLNIPSYSHVLQTVISITPMTCSVNFNTSTV